MLSSKREMISLLEEENLYKENGLCHYANISYYQCTDIILSLANAKDELKP